ncbi:hypothetical protein CIG19_01470 [Enterobacterales bacterium CwR94]|nr:hypothetical protein CIG19_01470 [Enterobacterales bacterium CwR94]
MKKLLGAVLISTLLTPIVATARPPGGPGHPVGPGWSHHGPGTGWQRPGFRPGPGGYYRNPRPVMRVLPGIASAVFIGGITYYFLNNNYYRRQPDSSYVLVPSPLDAPTGVRRALDYNGERYYVQDGHYYRRTINGEYREVPRPPGL